MFAPRWELVWYLLSYVVYSRIHGSGSGVMVSVRSGTGDDEVRKRGASIRSHPIA